MTELRECPFCGGDADWDNSDSESGSWIYCVECGVKSIGGTDYNDTISAWNRRADDWQPIETAPRDRPVEVYAPQPDRLQWGDALSDLPEIMCIAKWHPDAGFCVCIIREVTHWREVRRPLPKGPGG